MSRKMSRSKASEDLGAAGCLRDSLCARLYPVRSCLRKETNVPLNMRYLYHDDNGAQTEVVQRTKLSNEILNLASSGHWITWDRILEYEQSFGCNLCPERID
jgi:hypothetical protein